MLAKYSWLLITVAVGLCGCSGRSPAVNTAETEAPPSGEVEQLNAELADVDAMVAARDDLAAENRRLVQDLKLRGAEVRLTRRGVVVNLPDVLFEFDSAVLTADAKRNLTEIAAAAKTCPHRRIAVEGHTDAIGMIVYNQKLSEERARTVAEGLAADGVPMQRMTIYGFGETTPIASNRTEAGRKRNRRVEVIFENK